MASGGAPLGGHHRPGWRPSAELNEGGAGSGDQAGEYANATGLGSFPDPENGRRDPRLRKPGPSHHRAGNVSRRWRRWQLSTVRRVRVSRVSSVAWSTSIATATISRVPPSSVYTCREGWGRLSAQASQRDVSRVRLCGKPASAVRGALGCENEIPTVKVVDTTSDTTEGATPRNRYRRIVGPKVARACHWTHRQSVAVARPDTTLIPPGTQYGATLGKAQQRNPFR